MHFFKPSMTGPPPAMSGLRKLFGFRGAPAPAQRAWDRLGGLPLGLSPASWPRCGECGTPLCFLAQFQHAAARLDLGRPGRVLFVFFCENDPGMCDTWDSGSGANACLVVEPEALTAETAAAPAGLPSVYGTMDITGWTELDDGVSPEQARRCDAEDEILPDALAGQVESGTKLGGMPFWIQTRHPLAVNGLHFLGQIDSMDWAHGEGPNFGDAGIAYLLAEDADPARVELTWQCF